MMKEKDVQLEQEINEELAVMHKNNETNAAVNNEGRGLNDDDSSSQDTEFVNAIQQVNNSFETDNSSNASVEAEDVEVLRKQNCDFLQQSWANMAESAEAEQNLLHHLETEIPDNQGEFTLVTRPKGKTSKPKNPVTSSYATKTKTGVRKPFR